MKKRICLWLLLACMLSVAGCSSALQSKPSDLEFWIGENVDSVDFSAYQQRYGLMGGREYYASGYVPTVDENGEQKDPECCVIYTVTSYPDYSSKKKHITRITITDPAVEVYGLSIGSAAAEIESVMNSNGFKRQSEANSVGQTYQNGKVTIRFSNDSILIHIKVTNLFGMQF